MRTKEEREERRKKALARLRTVIESGVKHALRPLDDDDKEAAQALATGLLVAARDGITQEEENALAELWDSFKEARGNTP